MEPLEVPPAGHAEVRIVAASPEVSRTVAEVLRRCFASVEQRSYPEGSEGGTVSTSPWTPPARRSRPGPGW